MQNYGHYPMMHQKTGVDPGFTDSSRQLLDSKDKYYESEHEYSPVVTKYGNPIAHYGLPVRHTNIDNKFPHAFRVVIDPCSIIALETEALERNEFYWVPANGGDDVNVVYTEEDARSGVLKDDMTVVKNGDTRTYKGNVPSGFMFYHMYQDPATHQGHVIDEFQVAGTYYTEGFVIIPHLVKDGENTKYDFQQGDYIAPDNPSAEDKLINPKAKVGGWRVWNEAEKGSLNEGEIERKNFITYGKRKDSMRMAVAKVISVIDMETVHRGRAYFNETYNYGKGNMVGPETNGFLPTYWDYWKEGHDVNPYSASANNKWTKKEGYKMQLIYCLLGKK